MSAPFNWKWVGQGGDDEFGLQLDYLSIIEQMRNLEEQATLDAVIIWLRDHGYTVEKKEEA